MKHWLLSTTARICFAPEDGAGGGAPAAGTTDGGAQPAGDGNKPGTVLGAAAEAVETGAAADGQGEAPGKDGAAGKKDGAEGEGDGDGEKKPDGAPEAYADFTLPEGAQVDPALAEKALPVFKELNLSQEQAQKLVDVYADAQRETVARWHEEWGKTQEEWVTSLKADKEIGGTDLEKNVGVAAQAMKRFGTPALKEALERTGAGNNPEIIRFFYRVGKALADDTVVAAQPGAGTKSAAEVLYPTHGQSA